jgi:hypothetical protein
MNDISLHKAAADGRLDIIQKALANGYTYYIFILYEAIQYNRMNIIEWIYGANLLNPIKNWTIGYSIAAKYGHLNILKWLYANRIPWDEDTCSCAIKGGHYDVFMWAWNNGAPRTGVCRASMILQYKDPSDVNRMHIALFVHNSGCLCDSYNELYDRIYLSAVDYMYEEEADTIYSVPHQYIQKHSCCNRWTKANEPPSAHRWRTLRIYARIIGRLLCTWKRVLHCRYAPDGNGFICAKQEFEQRRLLL